MVSTDLTNRTTQESSTTITYRALRNTLPPISSNYQCLSDADCGVDQCCHKLLKNPIYSKRFLEIQSSGPFGDYYIGSRCSDKAKEGVFCPLNVCGCVKNLACRHIKMPPSMLQMSTPPNRPPTIKIKTPAMMKMWTTPMPMIPTIPDVQRVRRTFPPMRPGYYYRCV
ncbi:unnamed protein product [Mytilus edulis]|uniref:Uncharacterized protein n=1 Tax=Mytilus edulis TaxID=6550 RepID=A0A8S3TY15_MYTED|nr:unnamed protein product [Mytilus edulis]